MYRGWTTGERSGVPRRVARLVSRPRSVVMTAVHMQRLAW